MMDWILSGGERPVQLIGRWDLQLGVGGRALLAAPNGVTLFEERGHTLLRVVRQCVLGHD
jgi:hypothetical protein